MSFSCFVKKPNFIFSSIVEIFKVDLRVVKLHDRGQKQLRSASMYDPGRFIKIKFKCVHIIPSLPQYQGVYYLKRCFTAFLLKLTDNA